MLKVLVLAIAAGSIIACARPAPRPPLQQVPIGTTGKNIGPAARVAPDSNGAGAGGYDVGSGSSSSSASMSTSSAFDN